MKTLREIRKERGFSQEQFASILNIPRRTYQRYEEKSEAEIESEKIRETIFKALGMEFVDETHGILSLNEIRHKVVLVSERYPEVRCVYLFGSYAKGSMTKLSDVDLFYIGPKLEGLNVAGYYGELARTLHKNVDLLTTDNVKNEDKLIEEIFTYGIKLYQQK